MVVGNADTGRLQLAAVHVGQFQAGQNLQRAGVFGVAEDRSVCARHGGIVHGLNGQGDGAGQAVQVGVDGVHHRIADFDVGVAIEVGLDLQTHGVAIDQVHQGACGTQGNGVAVEVVQLAAGDGEHPNLCRGLAAVGMQVGNGECVEARERVFDDRHQGGQLVVIDVATGLWSGAAEHLHTDGLGGLQVFALRRVLRGDGDLACNPNGSPGECQVLQRAVHIAQCTHHGVVTGTELAHIYTIDTRHIDGTTCGDNVHRDGFAVQVGDLQTTEAGR